MEEFWSLFPILMVVAIEVVLSRWIKERKQHKAEQRSDRKTMNPAVGRVLRQNDPALDTTPDGPVPFGYQTSWAVVKCGSPDEVINALQLSGKRANWAAGLAAAEQGRGLFVSPYLDGYVLIVGRETWRVYPGCFDEVQQFDTQRVSDCARWALYRNGRKLREFSYEDGDVTIDDGPLTTEEQTLGFDAFPRKYERRESIEQNELRFPDEEDVLNIAAAWGIDPRFEKKTYPPSVGWLCT